MILTHLNHLVVIFSKGVLDGEGGRVRRGNMFRFKHRRVIMWSVYFLSSCRSLDILHHMLLHVYENEVFKLDFDYHNQRVVIIVTITVTKTTKINH